MVKDRLAKHEKQQLTFHFDMNGIVLVTMLLS